MLGWFVGLGYGFVENISYYTSFIQQKEFIGLAVRFIFGMIGGHGLYTGLTGAMIAYLMTHCSRRTLNFLWPASLIPGVCLHSINNGLLNSFIGDALGLLCGVLLSLLTLVTILIIGKRIQKNYISSVIEVLDAQLDINAVRLKDILAPRKLFDNTTFKTQHLVHLGGLLYLLTKNPSYRTGRVRLEIRRLKTKN